MGSINDYFSTDTKHNLTINAQTNLSSNDGTIFTVRIFVNLAVGAIYFAIFIPPMSNPLAYCLNILSSNAIEVMVSSVPKLVISSPCRTSSNSISYPVNTKDLVFCGRIYIYSETDLIKKEIDLIHKEGLKRGLFIEYYGPSWAKERSLKERPLAFISHDFRDKDEIARPLAYELALIGIQVWFDEFSLKLGDSLRESIEKGIKDTNFCILVLSKNFLSNEGWTKREFNSVFTKEIVSNNKVMLPIWHDVSMQEVYEYSPSLADRFAAKWDEGVKKIAIKIKKKIIRS